MLSQEKAGGGEEEEGAATHPGQGTSEAFVRLWVWEMSGCPRNERKGGRGPPRRQQLLLGTVAWLWFLGRAHTMLTQFGGKETEGAPGAPLIEYTQRGVPTLTLKTVPISQRAGWHGYDPQTLSGGQQMLSG